MVMVVRVERQLSHVTYNQQRCAHGCIMSRDIFKHMFIR
jgi:hypothetical protein